MREVLVDAVLKAGRALLRGASTADLPDAKASQFDYGMPADRESERLLVEAVRSLNLPSYGILAEESGVTHRLDAEYLFIIDPLDGTVNYSRAISSFCISVGVFHRAQPYLGIIYDPTLDELIVAEKGSGIQLNGRQLSPHFFSERQLVHVEWFGASRYVAVIEKVRALGLRARSAGSGVLALCYACLGRGDGAVLLQNRPWDIAAGLVLAGEVGLRVSADCTDLLSHDHLDLVAAPEALYATLMNVLL